MKKLSTTACAFALALAWSLTPATAQATSTETDQKADQVRKDSDRAADQMSGKSDRGEQTVGDKLDRAWDKTKATTGDVKDRVTGRQGGAASGDVRGAQLALKDKGFDPGPIDGIMGPRTSAAVREFQEKEALTVTGRLDEETRAKLGEKK